MSNVARRKESDLPDIKISDAVEKYMNVLDYEDELDEYEAIAAQRSMRRGLQLVEYGRSIAGNDQLSQVVVAAHVQSLTQNQVNRARRRIERG